jgi:hypothetical protein
LHARTYFGEKSGTLLARWLNSSATEEQVSLVEQFLTVKIDLAAPKTPQLVFRAISAGKQVSGLLGRSTFRLEIAPVVSGGRWTGWAAHWRPTAKYSRKKADSADAFGALLELAQRGLLVRLRRCSTCKIWFFARFAHQKFHVFKCQREHFRTDPDWKKKRREYMQGKRREGGKPYGSL